MKKFLTPPVFATLLLSLAFAAALMFIPKPALAIVAAVLFLGFTGLFLGGQRLEGEGRAGWHSLMSNAAPMASRELSSEEMARRVDSLGASLGGPSDWLKYEDAGLFLTQRAAVIVHDIVVNPSKYDKMTAEEIRHDKWFKEYISDREQVAELRGYNQANAELALLRKSWELPESAKVIDPAELDTRRHAHGTAAANHHD